MLLIIKVRTYVGGRNAQSQYSVIDLAVQCTCAWRVIFSRANFLLNKRQQVFKHGNFIEIIAHGSSWKKYAGPAGDGAPAVCARNRYRVGMSW